MDWKLEFRCIRTVIDRMNFLFSLTQNTSHLFSLEIKRIQCYILNPYWDYFLTNSKGGSNVYHKNTLVLI